MKRIAILGGTGMAGHVAVIYLQEKGHDVHFVSRTAPASEKSNPIDALNINALSAWLDAIKPDIILNCIGLLISESEKRSDTAIFLNGYLPRYLEHIYRKTSVKIIHLSTDCVFSGKRGSYLESDIPDGETVYDRSKALGEIINEKDLTFRMSIIGPDRDKSGTGLFNWFINQQGKVRGFSKALWNGVTTIELARAIDAAIRQDLTGLYQLAPKKPIDKYNLLLLFKEVFGKTDIEIEPYEDYVVDKTLINTRTDFEFEISSYPAQIKEMWDWIQNRRNLYHENNR